mmetsp:Transcript_17118/g.46686  ORF Transcript_17118/g.46686 Transcript_17118/m.46686 type:complete len:204 (+) Transcript_17118:279-890(+)
MTPVIACGPAGVGANSAVAFGRWSFASLCPSRPWRKDCTPLTMISFCSRRAILLAGMAGTSRCARAVSAASRAPRLPLVAPPSQTPQMTPAGARRSRCCRRFPRFGHCASRVLQTPSGARAHYGRCGARAARSAHASSCSVAVSARTTAATKSTCPRHAGSLRGGELGFQTGVAACSSAMGRCFWRPMAPGLSAWSSITCRPA